MNLNKKHILSWCLFDFANSSYSAVIAAVIFPVYYSQAVVGNGGGEGDLWWGRAISLSMAFIALSSPFLGGIADYAGLRKRFLFAYTYLCILSVAGFSLLHRGMIMEGFILIVLANMGLEGGLVFYNAFLPEITPKDHQGRVSSWGFGVGYAGSILSLLIAVPLVKGGHYGLTWLMVAAFFSMFSMPAFLFLPPDRKSGIPVHEASLRGLRYAIDTLKEIWGRRETRRFLLAYLVYEDGVNTVIVFSSLFAATTLGFAPQELIFLYLTVQVTALIGAFVMAKPTDLWGPKAVVRLSLILWTSVAILAYFVQAKKQFWGIAVIAGLGLGTVQAATRAFYAQFIPHGRESDYFGVYSMVGKSSAILGPLVFGEVSAAFGSQRPAILSVAAFFLVGLVIVHFVKGGGPNISRKPDEP
jgi:UMF1 family MFS transporter